MTRPDRYGPRLALAYGRAAEGIEVPQLNFAVEVLDADFALHLGAGLPQPHDAELGLGVAILQIDQVAGLQLNAHPLQRGPAAADGAQAGWLGEGTGIGVHAPDVYG